MTPAGTFDYDYDMSGALRGVWNESSGSRKQLETGLGAGTLETYNAAPPSGYSNFTYTGTSLLGSTAFRYNPGSGGIAKNYHFLPYGLEWPGEATDTTTSLKWTGHEQDSESGLYHSLFRNYSPLENRWLSPDPAGWAAADPVNPQSWDRYSYAVGSPCSVADPLGLAPPCQFNIGLNNRARIEQGELAAVESAAATVFSIATKGGVGLNFQFSGNADFTATLESSSPWWDRGCNGCWGTGSQGKFGVGQFANVYLSNIAAYSRKWHWSAVSTVRAAGFTLAHELGHEIAGFNHDSSALMSKNPTQAEFTFEETGDAGPLRDPKLQLSDSQIQKLLKDCQKQHAPVPGAGGGGGGGGGGTVGPTGPGDWDEFDLLAIEWASGWTITVTVGPPKN